MKDKSQFKKELESGGIPFTESQINYLYSKYQTDGRTIKKYDENTQIPVGYLSLIFCPKRKDLREKYINGKEWFVINTKSNRVLGSITFGMKIDGVLSNPKSKL